MDRHRAAGIWSRLARAWWVVALTVLLSLGGAIAFTRQQIPVYRTSSTLVVVPDSTIVESADIMRALETLERRTVLATFARLPITRKTRASVEERLGLAPEARRAYRVESSIVPNTNLIRIDVYGPDPERVTALARGLSLQARAEANRTYPIFSMEIVEEAIEPRGPIAPQPERSYLVALSLGLIFGIGVAYVGTSRQANPSASHA